MCKLKTIDCQRAIRVYETSASLTEVPMKALEAIRELADWSPEQEVVVVGEVVADTNHVTPATKDAIDQLEQVLKDDDCYD